MILAARIYFSDFLSSFFTETCKSGYGFYIEEHAKLRCEKRRSWIPRTHGRFVMVYYFIYFNLKMRIK